jgi:hypothetical protein
MSSRRRKEDNSWRRHLHRGDLVVFWFLKFCGLIIFAAWLFNLLTPKSWHFLDESQHSQLQNLMIIVFGSSIADNAKRLVGKLK